MQRENEVQHVFLVGAKSLGAYGGECEIIWATREKPDFMRVYAAWPFHLNLFLPVMVRYNQRDFRC